MPIFVLHSLLAALWFSSPAETTQERHYQIIYRHEPAGTLRAIKATDGARVSYENHTSLTIKMLATLRMKFYQQAVYQQGILQSADFKVWVNGSLHRNSSIRQHGEGYQLRINNKESFHPGAIQYSAACLVLDEPRQLSRIFSEQHGEYHLWKPDQAAHQYHKVDPSGKVNRYRYHKGVLQWAELDAGLLSFELHLK